MGGSDSQAYQVFLTRDPRAGDIWQAELQRLSGERRSRMEEAKALGDEVNNTKEAMSNVQMAMEKLKEKLRAAEDAASIDASAKQKAEMLRSIIASEEPKLEIALAEKSQNYKSGCARLKELKHELIHLEHARE